MSLRMGKELIGKIVEWDVERGFGFLQSGSARVFLHRREFSERRKDIELGDQISFLMGVDAQGRPCAKGAGHVGHGGTLNDFHLLLLVAHGSRWNPTPATASRHGRMVKWRREWAKSGSGTCPTAQICLIYL